MVLLYHWRVVALHKYKGAANQADTSPRRNRYFHKNCSGIPKNGNPRPAKAKRSYNTRIGLRVKGGTHNETQ